MAPAKLLGFLLLLFICLKYVHTGKSKKTIKIHVPYYVKHIHHYKKVYVPKVQVVKHEHLHKKEHEHHHHHDHHDHHHISHHGHDHGYDKSGSGGYNEDYDSYYDDIDHRSYTEGSKSNRLAKSRQKVPYRAKSGTRDSWRDEPSEEELTSSEEDDYITGPDEEGTVPAPLSGSTRFRPRPVGDLSTLRRVVRKRDDGAPTAASAIFISPSAKTLKRIIGRVAT